MSKSYGFILQLQTYIDLGVITLPVQLAEIKNKMSEYVRAVQNGSSFGSPVTLVVDNSVAMRCGVATAGNLAD